MSEATAKLSSIILTKCYIGRRMSSEILEVAQIALNILQ